MHGFFYSFSDEMTNSFKNPKCKYLQNFETDGFAIMSIFKRYTQKYNDFHRKFDS